MKKFEEELFSKVPCKFRLSTEGEYRQSILVKHFGDWISPEDHQAEVAKFELQNLKYRAEILGMQKSLRKKNKAIKELNGAVKKNKERLKDWHSDEEFQLLLRDRDTLKQGNDNLFKNHLELVEENDELKAKLEKQQPEIPEFVAKYIEKYKGARTVYGILDKISRNQKVYPKLYEWVFKNEERQEIFAQAWLNGYTVAKEKRYEVVFLEDDTTRQILMENNAGYYFIEEESENYGYWKQDFAEMEIKEINEKFWQLSVPVKDEQIEVEE